MKNRTTFRNERHNTKVAHVDKVAHAEYLVSVWHDNGNIAARWFKGHSTCSNTYKSFRAAEQAARKFLGISARPQIRYNRAGQPCLDLSQTVDADDALAAIGKCVETIITPKK